MAKEPFNGKSGRLIVYTVESIKKVLIPFQFLLLELAFIQFLIRNDALVFIPRSSVEEPLAQILEFTLKNNVLGFVVPIVIIFAVASVFSMLLSKEINPFAYLGWLGKICLFFLFPLLAAVFDYSLLERAFTEPIFYAATIRFGSMFLALIVINFLSSMGKK